MLPGQCHGGSQKGYEIADGGPASQIMSVVQVSLIGMSFATFAAYEAV